MKSGRELSSTAKARHTGRRGGGGRASGTYHLVPSQDERSTVFLPTLSPTMRLESCGPKGRLAIIERGRGDGTSLSVRGIDRAGNATRGPGRTEIEGRRGMRHGTPMPRRSRTFSAPGRRCFVRTASTSVRMYASTLILTVPSRAVAYDTYRTEYVRSTYLVRYGITGMWVRAAKRANGLAIRPAATLSASSESERADRISGPEEKENKTERDKARQGRTKARQGKGDTRRRTWDTGGCARARRVQEGKA